MITPAGWTPSDIIRPSVFFAYRIISLTASYCWLSLYVSIIIFSQSDIDVLAGINLQISSARSAYFSLSPHETPTNLAAFLVDALACCVMLVRICDTLSLPYLFVTYWIATGRISSEKSISISGIVTLSGFRKRSNFRLYINGSILVISKKKQIRQPAAEPLPGPTEIPICDSSYSVT